MSLPWLNEGFVQINGKQLEYACYGPVPDEAPTIILLHEGLGCCRLWRDFPQQLAEATGLGVFVYSRAGYGKSDGVELPRPLDYMTREALDVLPGLIEKTGTRQCILLGHSDGATIAAIYAGSLFDSRLCGLVLMAPHFFTEPMGLASIRNARDAYQTEGLKEKLAKYHKDPEVAFRGWNDSWLHPEFEDWDVSDVIEYIRIPILAVQGAQDQYGTLAQIEVLDERGYAPVDKLVLEDCKHSPFLDQTQKLLDQVSIFCARLGLTAHRPSRGRI